MDDVISSWISTGKNFLISAERIKSVPGNQQIQQPAANPGVSTETVSEHLTDVLPKVIDKLTPDGSLPASDKLVSKSMGLLKG